MWKCCQINLLLTSFLPYLPRQDSAVLVVCLQSAVMSEELYMLEAFFSSAFLQSIPKKMKVNKKQ